MGQLSVGQAAVDELGGDPLLWAEEACDRSANANGKRHATTQRTVETAGSLLRCRIQDYMQALEASGSQPGGLSRAEMGGGLPA